MQINYLKRNKFYINNYMYILATILLLSLFIFSSINKMRNLEGTANYLKSGINLNIPFLLYKLAIIMVIILQFIGSNFVIYSMITNNYKLVAYYIVLGLILFTLLATLIFHNPLIKDGETINLLKNISLIGGLILLLDKFNN